ncbi:MAG: DUF1015 domain-containing protein, partial [Candidatus Helarchaeota archaeon]|nr:DUF1015 domain-containing protein [Candidatus Helarchaeota archaeon]
RPFKAYHYNTAKKLELEKVLAPPHDVISPEERIGFQKKSPYNIIRLILPDSYPAAGQMLNDLIKQKIVIQRNLPAFYIYGTKNMLNGVEFIRYGLVALVKLYEFSEKQVFPHEKTFKKVAEGRLNLLRETQANFSPIFFLFDGSSTYSKILQKYTKKSPIFKTIDGDEVEHMLWVIEDKHDIETLQQYFKPIPLTIADGHHRYLSALMHSQENGSKHIMGLLVDINDPGLVVLPTHRQILRVPNLTAEQILNRLRAYFQIEEFKFNKINVNEKVRQALDRLNTNPPNSYGVVMQDQLAIFLLTPKSDFHPESLIDGNWSEEWKRLDVSVLHEFILKKLLEIPEEIEDSKNIAYSKKAVGAIQDVLAGKFQLLFILNPTRVDQIFKVTAKSELMPHKSTYFYPKPLSGLVFYKWNANSQEQ